MKNKLISLQKAVSMFTQDGMQYSGGAGAPVGSDSVIFGREMAKQGKKNLHYISHCCTQQMNLLCALGYVDKIETGFSALEAYGFAKGLRRAVESGKTLIEDYSNLTIILRIMGGALNWPFVPTITNVGSDLQWRSGFATDEYPCKSKIPMVKDPFSGKEYGVMSVLKPDLASIHVTMADVEGNAIILGTEWGRFELARAAKKVVLIADQIVDTDAMRQFPNMVRISDFLVEAVIPWELCCWPACSPGLYDSDEEHFKMMNNMLASEEGTAEYMEKYVNSWSTQEEFLEVIGQEKVDKLSKNISTAHLMEPFVKYLKSRDEVKRLMEDSIYK